MCMVFIQQVINGLAQGGIYALIAIGWTTVFGIVGVMNWTHGEVYMLGAYAGYFLTTAGHLPLVPALLLSMVIGSLIAMLVGSAGVRPLRKAGTLGTSGFITALGPFHLPAVYGQRCFYGKSKSLSGAGEI